MPDADRRRPGREGREGRSTRPRGRVESGPRLDQPLTADRRLIRRPEMDPDAFGRFAEGFARFMGTARFLAYMTGFVAIWLAWNVLMPEGLRFDPYAFIFLTLMLSLQASYAAPLILLAQNRQADRDKVVLEQDRSRDERALADTEFLTREVASLRLAMRDSATRDFVRGELRGLLEEMEERGLRVVRDGGAEPAGAADGGPSGATDGPPPAGSGDGRA